MDPHNHTIFSPVDFSKFDKHLRGYNECERELVVSGFKEGFRLHFEGDRHQRVEHPNMPSARKYPHVLWAKIMKEVVAGRVAGPFDECPFDSCYISPLGLVPKAGQDGEFRMIFNLSAGGNASVNGQTPQKYKTTKYKDLDAAVEMVQKIGSQARVAKADLEAAFRQTPIHPEDWSLLVFKAWDPLVQKEKYFFDKCLPFGSGESCQIYQRISNGLAWVVEKYTGSPLVNYLDDFFFGDFGLEACNSQVHTFLDVCTDIGFPVSASKTEWAAELQIFLGLLIHGKLQIIALPQNKIAKALKFVEFFREQKKATVKQFMAIAGLLNFLTRALNFGRPFIRAIYDHIRLVQDKLRWHLKISEEIKSDMLMWEAFLTTEPHYKSFVEFLEQPASEVGLYTDASGNPSLGLGCVFNNTWMVAAWPQGFIKPSTSTCFLELVAVALAVEKWAPLLTNQRVILHCDNQATVAVVNAGTSRCPLCMVLIRKITSACLHHNCRIRCKYISTKDNCAADSLSRFQFKKFFQLNPSAAGAPVDLPESLWPLPQRLLSA